MACFVIGNGPSLNKVPFGKLKDHITFATGRINLKYSETDWRPTFYVLAEKLRRVDETRIRRDLREILRPPTFGYIQKGMESIISGVEKNNCTFFVTCLHALGNPPESWHLPSICSYGSSVHVALQIATMSGHSPIYLIGCDLTGGHFSEKYGDSVTEPELWRKAHEIAKNSGAKIYNATIGGNLEVYKRVDLESII